MYVPTIRHMLDYFQDLQSYQPLNGELFKMSEFAKSNKKQKAQNVFLHWTIRWGCPWGPEPSRSCWRSGPPEASRACRDDRTGPSGRGSVRQPASSWRFSLVLKWPNSSWGRHSSVDSSGPTILQPWVRIPNTPFMLFPIMVKFHDLICATKICRLTNLIPKPKLSPLRDVSLTRDLSLGHLLL